ncbi:pepsin/retropepsin-like aspartic protease family protein [Asticcacaulis sp. AND118]|uniref:pepsin/retropepsin-like aspartic protease family protein n=1 Tax=Asticcacaulis sp. AND118 TaxID=2840468 RepID=UPI001CFFA41D|nr:pepsin/retropepsin-like aspartic protease family protein [Asticcacaulis sp. AND118]UDF04985.1 aspartyl protease family protein [Asticcacaulis sp. AND118]
MTLATRRFFMSTLSMLTLAGSSALARSTNHPDILDAIASRDIDALEAWRGEGDDKQLADAVVLALRHKDEHAIARLTAFAASNAPVKMRATALTELGAIYLRQSQFSLSHKAFTAAGELDPSLASEVQTQTTAFVAALSQAPAMSLVQSDPTTLPLTRDLAGLARIDVAFDANSLSAVLDSGAAFSTITQTTAQKLGLTFLESSASVGSVSRAAITTRFAVASKLRIGKAVLKDVVFIVLPDEQLSFAGGKYTIDVIIGLPVMLDLGKLTFASEGVSETFSFDAKGKTPGKPNLILSGVQPLMQVRTAQGGHRLRMFVDTGARQTSLHRTALLDYPDLGKQAETKAATVGGAGGTAVDAAAMVLPRLLLEAAGRQINLPNIRVLSKAQPDRHGEIGQDFLRQAKSFTLDFNSMILSMA